MTKLSQRKQYAIACLSKGVGATHSRAFDNCFEMGDGEAVSQYILDYINSAPLKKPEFNDYATKDGDAFTMQINSPQWKTYRKKLRHFQKASAARLALIEGGFTWFIERLKNNDLTA